MNKQNLTVGARIRVTKAVLEDNGASKIEEVCCCIVGNDSIRTVWHTDIDLSFCKGCLTSECGSAIITGVNDVYGAFDALVELRAS